VLPRYQAVGEERSPATYRARYDAEVRYTDDNVKAVVGALQARGLWDRVIFVLTADHGESLGEHAYYFQHGVFAYEDSMRVPLVIHAPERVPAGRRVDQTVSLIDVVPTVLELAALPAAPEIEGQSLMPLVRGEERENRTVFAQTYYGTGLTMLRVGGLKYVLTPAAGPGARRVRGIPPALVTPPTERVELYDLAIDPGETEDESQNRPRLTASLRKELDAWLEEQRAREQTVGTPGDEPTDQGLEERLRALGYAD
jgi:arylsulfatase A-like enzyme